MPFDSSLIDSFPQFKRTNLKELFKGVSDRAHLLDLLLKMLAYLPEERLSAKEVMQHPFFREVRDKQQ